MSGGTGPTLTGLTQGSYVVHFGGAGTGTLAANVRGFMAVSVNGSTRTDADACEFQQDGHCSGARVVLAQLTIAGNMNTLKCVYRTSDGTDRCDVRQRWITAIRYSG